MKLNRVLHFLSLSILGFLLVGCAFKGQYQPKLLSQQLSLIEAKFDGQALVLTDSKEDLKLYQQGPSSLTGAATSLSINVGGYLKDISVEVFSRLFKEGAIHSNNENESGEYVVIIKPEILNYDWRFNQLKNLGFAITPEYHLSIGKPELISLTSSDLPYFGEA